MAAQRAYYYPGPPLCRAKVYRNYLHKLDVYTTTWLPLNCHLTAAPVNSVPASRAEDWKYNSKFCEWFFPATGNSNFPVAEDWHSGTASTGWLRSATGTNAHILANPVPLRNCIRNTKRQQWRTDSPKKLTTLPSITLLSKLQSCKKNLYWFLYICVFGST